MECELWPSGHWLDRAFTWNAAWGVTSNEHNTSIGQLRHPWSNNTPAIEQTLSARLKKTGGGVTGGTKDPDRLQSFGGRSVVVEVAFPVAELAAWSSSYGCAPSGKLEIKEDVSTTNHGGEPRKSGSGSASDPSSSPPITNRKMGSVTRNMKQESANTAQVASTGPPKKIIGINEPQVCKNKGCECTDELDA
ncbi:hypothetical protein V2J09_013262 [Rumex salicifolius]